MANPVIALIPARGGSKGVPGKNLRLINGKPLIAYSIRAAALSSQINRVIVSTDDEEIAKVSKEFGAEVPFMRPASLAGDRSTDLDVLKHFVDWQREKESKDKQATHLVHLRPTTPLRDPNIIDQAILKIKNEPNFTALRSAHEMSETAYKTCEIEKGLIKAICSGDFNADKLNAPRQTFPSTYQLNGYVDVVKCDFIIKENRLHGNQCGAFLTDIGYEIDRIEDFDFIEFILSRNPLLFKKLFS